MESLTGFLLFFTVACGGWYMGEKDTVTKVKGNTVEGYHCTPITKHKTLESAFTQVRKYQDG